MALVKETFNKNILCTLVEEHCMLEVQSHEEINIISGFCKE